MMMRKPILVVLAGSLVACGLGPRPPDDNPAGATLSIDPTTSDHVLVDGAPAHQQFTATLIETDGTRRDVTSDTVFLVDGSFGTFEGSDLTIGSAGEAEVRGTWGDRTATAKVIARLTKIRVDPGLPSSTPGLFTGQEVSTFAPSIVYPPDNVSMPRNVGDFEVHWTSSTALDIFEVSLETDYTDVRVYVPGGNGQPAAGPDPSWMRFLVPEWNAAVAAESTVRFQVRGVSSASPGVVHAAPPRIVHLSNEPMQGGIYYWASTATQGGSYGIFRHDMSKPGEPAEEFMTTSQTNGRCVACHSLSRNGSRMAVTYDGGNGAATVVDVATKTPQPVTNAWNFATFTPDAKQVLTIRGLTLTVRDASTQAVLATMPGTATHPELSPDGKTLVYVRPMTPNWDWMFGGGQIMTRTYDQATQAFGPEQPLVTNGANNYYPSWSPDGQWIVFNRSEDSTGNGAYNNPSASVWVVKADGSLPPTQLTAANQGLGLTNSWARFAPFEQTTGVNHERMFWLTVSSKRDFGTRLVNSGRPEDQKAPQLWMIAFYPDQIGAADPGSPAFWLPFQNLDTRNHSAQWTEQVVVIQ